jgi:hypothetical protein
VQVVKGKVKETNGSQNHRRQETGPIGSKQVI